MVTFEWVKQNLIYNPETGVWKKIVNSRRRKGLFDVGSFDEDGYLYIGIKGKNYAAHRLAWFWMTGEWPKADIDHWDTNPSNNCWDNLREATRSQNAANSGLRNTNKSGRKGVFWDRQTAKWRVLITVRGKSIHLGRFAVDQLNEAGLAYARAAQNYFGEFARVSND